MSVFTSTIGYRDQQRESVAWKLLHAQHAPYIIAILDEHLGGEVTRVPVAELTELVQFDIDDLSERILEMPLTRPAKDYLEDWRREGYLVRKPASDVRQETYELSSGALAAIGFAKNLAQPRRTATKSRLGIIFDQIDDLAFALGSDDAKRKEALLAQRKHIDEKIAQIDAGEYEPIGAMEAREQALEIVGLAREIPQDFAAVSMEFERISKAIYTELIGYDESHSDILEDVFAGVDHIAQSPEGQSFRGFYDLLQDQERTESLYDSIDSILKADFSQELTLAQRRFLRNLMHMLLQQGRSVNETMTGLARSLRRFVQSQSFQEDRLLRRIIDQSLSIASELTDHYAPTTVLPVQLELTSTRIDPISRQKLRDPSDGALPPPQDMVQDTSAPALSLEQLRQQIREVEIDFTELSDNVNASLQEAQSSGMGAVSLGAVLEQFPATQGVASVVGLMMLACEQGKKAEGHEIVTWSSLAGVERCARVERYEFVEEVR